MLREPSRRTWACLRWTARATAVVACLGCAADNGSHDGRGNAVGGSSGTAAIGGGSGDGSANAGANGDTAGTLGIAGTSGAAGSGAGGMAGDGASAADGGTGGASGASGSHAPDPSLDPNLMFSWPQSLPGQGTCKPGKYTGTFTCVYNAPSNAFSPANLMVSGPVTFELKKSMSGEFLEISDGNLIGIASGFIGFDSKLSGKLDCSTLELTAQAVDGVFGPGDPPLPIGMFKGMLSGKLDTQTLTLAGDWSLTETAQNGTCVGPWTATLQP